MLCSKCEGIIQPLKTHSKRKYLVRFVNALRDKDVLRDFERELQGALNQFKVSRTTILCKICSDHRAS